MRLQCVIVDDNEPFLKVARRVLERQGMAVVGVAANGAEALRQARELRPDVALVDISLGAESGFDVGRQQHAERVLGSEPVLVFSQKLYALGEQGVGLRAGHLAGVARIVVTIQPDSAARRYPQRFDEVRHETKTLVHPPTMPRGFRGHALVTSDAVSARTNSQTRPPGRIPAQLWGHRLFLGQDADRPDLGILRVRELRAGRTAHAAVRSSAGVAADRGFHLAVLS